MLKSLVQPRILALRHSLTRKTVLRRLPLIVIGAGFWLFLYWITLQVLTYVRGIAVFGEVLSSRLFSLVFFSLTGFLILSNIITSLSSFYLSRDIPFLLSKPVHIRDIISLKTLETIFNSSWMVISFIPPVFVAYGVSYHAPALYYLVLMILFILFITMTAGIGITLSHVLTRIVPARRMLNIFLGAGLVLFLLFYLFLKSLVPKTPDSTGDIVEALFTLKTDMPLLPGFWITETITPFFKTGTKKLFYGLVLLSNSIFFLLVSFYTGAWLYRTNLERMEPSRSVYRGKHSPGYYPGAWTSIAFKDIKVFTRDTAQWSQVLIIISLVLVYVYNFRTIPIATVSELIPYARELMVLINMLLAGLVLSAVAARFIYVSVSLEGQAFWIIKASPVSMKRFLWSKFLLGFLPVSVLMTILVFLTNIVLDIGPALMILSLLTVILLSLSVGGLGTGYGAIFPDFRYENINAVSMSINGMIFMVIAFSIVIITLALETWIGYLLYQAGGLKRMGLQEMAQAVICLVLILTVNAAGFIIPMKKGLRKLADMQF